MTLRKTSTLTRGKDILREEGLVAFIKRASLSLLRFLKDFFFRYESYYLYEYIVDETAKVKYTPRIQNLTIKAISTPKELSELIAAGFDISSHLNIEKASRRIERGAILYCIFVGKEFAHRSWLCLSNEAKKEIDRFPYTVDFQNEIGMGDAETYEPYRGTGLLTYVTLVQVIFMKEKGYRTVKVSVRKDIIAPQKTHARLGARIVAEGRRLKLLGREFWKVKPVKDVKQ